MVQFRQSGAMVSGVHLCSWGRLRTISSLNLASLISRAMQNRTIANVRRVILTRVISSIEVDSDCCIIQSSIIWYYTMQSAQVPIIQNNTSIVIVCKQMAN